MAERFFAIAGSDFMSATLIDPKRIRTWTKVRPWRNLALLGVDYLTLALILGAAMWFAVQRPVWGLHWLWQVPVWAVAAFFVGIVQHRIGLMGHEASHYLLVPNRKWNDFLADWLVFYPLFAALIQYRSKHLGHHLYPNDPDRDPNMLGGRAERLYARFPMPKRSFIYQYYLKFFWPPFVFRNLLDLFQVLSVGSGMAPMARGPAIEAPAASLLPEVEKGKSPASTKTAPGEKKLLPTILGIAYLAAQTATIRLALYFEWPMWMAMGVVWLAGAAVWSLLPQASFFRGARLAYDVKLSALSRLTYHTLMFFALGFITQRTGYDTTLAFFVLWILPLVYVFPYFMLLREIYQHANAGRGELDNSRVMYADPFTRWALLGYGNDYHLIHHIYPNIPHDRLAEVHRTLMAESEEYRAAAEESHGVIQGPEGHPSILDRLAGGTA